MIIRLLSIGLVAIPFLELIVYGLLPAQVDYADTRIPKEFLSIFFCFAIIFLKIINGGLKIPTKNIFLILFLPWMFISLMHAPNFGMTISDLDITGFWNFKPMLYVFIYFMLFSAIVDEEWTRFKIHDVVSIISHCGLAMALWAVTQRFGFDQVFFASTENVMTGSLGRADIMGCFLATCLPASLYFKRWWHVAFTVFVIAFSNSEMSMASAVVCSAVYFLAHRKRVVIGIGIVLLMFFAVVTKLEWDNSRYIDSKISKFASGRIAVWRQSVEDITGPVFNTSRRTFFMTGMGPGAYRYIFPIRHPKMMLWKQAHNEYLEVLYNYGFGGLCFFMAAIGFMVWKVWRLLDFKKIRVFLAIFSALAVGSFGTFLWQLAPFQYLTVICVGILHFYIQRRSIGDSQSVNITV